MFRPCKESLLKSEYASFRIPNSVQVYCQKLSEKALHEENCAQKQKVQAAKM